jgi:hypothetical protein
MQVRDGQLEHIAPATSGDWHATLAIHGTQTTVNLVCCPQARSKMVGLVHGVSSKVGFSHAEAPVYKAVGLRGPLTSIFNFWPGRYGEIVNEKLVFTHIFDHNAANF